MFGISYSDKNGLDGVMKGKTAKNYLSKVFQEGMNMKYLEEIDPNGEVKDGLIELHLCYIKKAGKFFVYKKSFPIFA